VLLKALVLDDLHIGVSALPNLAAKTKFLVGAKGKAAFDQLHRLLETHLARYGHQNVNAIGHNHEVVNGDFPGTHVGSKNFDEERRHRGLFVYDFLHSSFIY